jgi:hypothetical protein
MKTAKPLIEKTRHDAKNTKDQDEPKTKNEFAFLNLPYNEICDSLFFNSCERLPNQDAAKKPCSATSLNIV